MATLSDEIRSVQEKIEQLETNKKTLQTSNTNALRELQTRVQKPKVAPTPNIEQLRQSELTSAAEAAVAAAAQHIDLTVPDGIGGKHRLKSGYELKSQQPVKRVVYWPHCYLSGLPDDNDTHPDKLSLDSFMFGYSKILITPGLISEEEHYGRLRHLNNLMQFSIAHGWDAARNYHKQVIRSIENGDITWSDDQQIISMGLQALHNNYAAHKSADNQSDASKHKKTEQSSTKDKEKSSESNASGGRRTSTLCWSYNNEEYPDAACRFSGKGDTCRKLHACSICADKGFHHMHKAKFECKNRSNQTKDNKD
jgi:uncharacterized protein (UPF0335 family)